jgi:hypothetical protein
MINTTPQLSKSIGDINYLIIEHLKSVPFKDNNQKDQLIKKVRLYYIYIILLTLSCLCYDLIQIIIC